MQSSSALHVDLADLPGQARALLRLRGPDTERFLQGLLSADISAMKPGQSTPGALLTVKGKIISEVIVLRDDEGFALVLPAEIHEAVTGDLDRHIIMDDVTLHPSPEDGFSLLWGFVGDPPAGQGQAKIFTAIHPAPGLLIVGSAEDRRAVVGELPSADVDTFTGYRVATGTPAWGHEIRPNFFPPEVGFVAAVSYDKGCFRGQEPLSRIHSRGQVNRVMARVRAEAAPADPALSAESRPAAGTWTSWAPKDGGVEGLAVLHRSVAAPGQTLSAGDLRVEVLSGPLGDDPGVGKASKGTTATVKLGGRR